ncbi:MAG: 6-phosphogluconolactonase, partial [Mariprofundus sp.]|nr:6-phosphogluconolactonase [Mariprofundus sp.]
SKLPMSNSVREKMNTLLCADAEAVALRASTVVVEVAAAAIAARGVFHWVLAGGTTPKRCYQLLREASVDWSKVHIWFGDERCLPVGDAARNDQMADEALLKDVAIPAAQIHRMNTELGAEAAAEQYAILLKSAPVMDLVLLGIGEDGHTASLFPDNPGLDDLRLALPVYHSPKPPSDRVSMGYAVLNSAHRCLMMVAGKGKADAMSRIFAGEKLPVARIPKAEWLIDHDAMGD